jgi:hypothetical protein
LSWTSSWANSRYEKSRHKPANKIAFMLIFLKGDE